MHQKKSQNSNSQKTTIFIYNKVDGCRPKMKKGKPQRHFGRVHPKTPSLEASVFEQIKTTLQEGAEIILRNILK